MARKLKRVRTKPTAEPGVPRVAALERGLSILAAFHGASTLSLAELAQITGLYKSTILRLAASLQRLGFLQRLEDGRFRLGPAVFQLGRLYQASFRLGELVRPALRDLAAATGESASLYVREGTWEICLHRVDSAHAVRDAGIAEGDRFEIDDSACSRVLTAFSGALGSEYDIVRRDLAVFASQTRRAPGTAALACPVFGVGQTLIGALLVTGPEQRFTHALAEIRIALLRQAVALTQALGGDAAMFSRRDREL